MMKKLLALLLSAAMALSLLTACGGNGTTTNGGESGGDGGDAAAEPMSLKMHLSCGTTDYVYTAGERFAELVSEKTDGNLTIELYPSSSLGTTASCLEGLALGTANIVFDSVGNLATYTDLANIDAAPYLYNSIDHYCAVMEGEIGDQIRADIGAACGMTLLGYGLQGVRVMTTVSPVESVADVAGMKLRVPTISIYLDTWEWLGAAPTPMSSSDVFTAIQQHTVDGQENPYGASAGLSMQECCPYVTETNHVYSGDSFIFDANFFNSLPAEYQTALTEAAEEACSYLTDLAESESEAKKQIFVDAGCEIITPDLTEWKDAMDGFLEEKYPSLVEYAEQIAAADPAAQ